MPIKISSITQLFRIPSPCVLCKQYHQNRLAVCLDCSQLLKPITSCCNYCALPLPKSDFMICGLCIKKPPYFDHTFAAFHFAEPLRSLLHKFKYNEGLYLTNFLGAMMLTRMPEKIAYSECLIPVPLHPKRLHERGFNQTLELCKYLTRQLKIPYDFSICHKIKQTKPQAGLNNQQRKSNLRGSFMATPSRYQHVTLVDDLMTTGSTANELAKTLKKQGIARVDVWCCARANTPFIE
ncbi:MAG: ComF family protein [Legionella sp.]